MSRRTAAPTAIACALVFAFAAAGCGDDQASAIDVLAAAPDTTLEESTARTTVDIEVSVRGRTVDVDSDGVVDLRSGDGVLHTDATQFGIPALDEDLEMRIIDGVAYIDVGPVFEQADEEPPPQLRGKRWLAYDLAQAQEAGEALGTDASGGTTALQYLRGVSADGIEEVGSEEVRGTDTTHYRADIDLDTVKEKLRESDLSDDARAFIEKGLRQIRGETMRTDVWVDDDGRVRRQDLDMQLATPGGDLEMDMRIEYFDFGVEVNVEKPPADQVFDLDVLTELGAEAA